VLGGPSVLRLGLVLVGVLLGLGWMHAGGAVLRDRTPPTFAGLRSASTCIPGPVGGDRLSSYRLAWTAARDNVTRPGRILYDIYQATSPAGERLSRATYTSRRGVTTFTTSPLSSAKTYFFVVRARDAAGNRDRNRRERAGLNLCE
jgi:hypothetical protein